jgi:hypothetical protein
LPPGGTPRIQGGDTLVIGAGNYRMGFGAPGADDCSSDFPWDCSMPPLPSGPSPSNPTRILGAGSNSGCANPPQLWGAERAYHILNLTGSDNVLLDCLEITDRSGCVESHSGSLACERDTYPYGDWAAGGIYAQDSSRVRLRNLNIHGLAHHGVWAGRLTDWTVENVRIAGNGWVGWDGDIYGDDSNAGTLLFRHLTVEWNGCGETYPGGQPAGCWGQEAGGYGDGIGTGLTGGHWIFEDSAIRHNTSDGLDLLYARLADSSIEIRRVIAEGNAGNQVKTTGPAIIENSVIVGNCGFFHGMEGWDNGDDCRAYGDALAMALRPGNQVNIINSTLSGHGNCLMISTCAPGQTCNGTETIRVLNGILLGQPRMVVSGENACYAWYNDESGDTLPQNPFTTSYSLIGGTRFGNVTPCPGPHNLCSAWSGLVNSSMNAFDARLVSGSAAIDSGSNSGCPAADITGFIRPADGNGDGTATCDLGAYEWPPHVFYLPLLIRGWPSQ